jgi:hypothetical protein
MGDGYEVTWSCPMAKIWWAVPTLLIYYVFLIFRSLAAGSFIVLFNNKQRTTNN